MKTAATARKRNKTWSKILQNYDLYIFLLPAVLLTFCFTYIPMYGIVMAFQDFTPSQGVFGSPWVGLEHFRRFFSSYQAKNLIINTLALSIYGMVATFPLPIVLALMLNQMKALKFKKTLQTITYMPHFISIVVVVSMLNIFLSPSTGLYGNICRLIGVEPMNLMGTADAFRSIYVWSDVWQHTGWDSVIYLAALAAVDPTLYEAATVDGASRLKKMIHIDFPSILPTCTILLILRVGGLMGVGFDKAFLMQNALNTTKSEIISTYTYKVGIVSAQYSFSAAVGLFNTIINFILLVSVNAISRKLSDNSLW
ncbi:MAG TPA: sugar ABC transporter permease [Candidatus Merdivicinus excrementipullorum]|uniref:Sugar ABC transporter permease n=1 Tax=Candidatus Merdivicinus excrementipullorum TaxID=2840867 RepID=A0A9D1FMG9_9FIRM|nr:sugar ABC transporter permease [Candidatus Merdivicinus excrementipullorum]